MQQRLIRSLLAGIAAGVCAITAQAQPILAHSCFGTGLDAGQVSASGPHRLTALALEGPAGPPMASLAWRCTPGYLQGVPGWLPAPGGLALSVGLDLLQLSWTAVPGARAYQVRSSAEGHAGFAPDGTGSFSGTTWSAPLPGERRFYRVTALH